MIQLRSHITPGNFTVVQFPGKTGKLGWHSRSLLRLTSTATASVSASASASAEADAEADLTATLYYVRTT